MREPRVGEYVKVITKSVPELYGKEVRIVAAKWCEIVVRLKWGREDYHLVDSDIEYLEPESIATDEKKEIIKRFVMSSSLKTYKSLCFEIGILHRLMEKYPNVEFWRTCTPEYEVQSLKWYEGGGERDLTILYNSFNLDFKVSAPIIREKKVVEDIALPVKPKSTLKWLKEK